MIFPCHLLKANLLTWLHPSTLFNVKGFSSCLQLNYFHFPGNYSMLNRPLWLFALALCSHCEINFSPLQLSSHQSRILSTKIFCQISGRLWCNPWREAVGEKRGSDTFPVKNRRTVGLSLCIFLLIFPWEVVLLWMEFIRLIETQNL